jgi:hypothetical protein
MAYSGPIPMIGSTQVRPAPLRFKRRRSNAAMVSDYLALRKAVLLCASCAWRMPYRWLSRYTYCKLPGFHGHGACTKCQEVQSGDLYLPEDDIYMTNWHENKKTEDAARRMRIAMSEGRRLRVG